MDKVYDMSKKMLNEIVINYHLNEVCNYNCRYCYSKWEITQKYKRDQNISDRLQVIRELRKFFYDQETDNPLRQLMSWNKVRINFSGGEPMLIHRIDEIIQEAKQLGFNASLITNGSLLNDNNLPKIAPYLVKLGVSLDSPKLKTLQEIGRTTRSGKHTRHEAILFRIEQARAINPAIIIKVNTVVSQYNHHEDFSPLIDSIEPDEWSAIQVLPFFDKQAAIPNDTFERFITFHKKRYPDLLFAETNEDYDASFLMISPENGFFSNRDNYFNKNYKRSDAIHKVGAATALAQIDFDYDKYIERHQRKHTLYQPMPC